MKIKYNCLKITINVPTYLIKYYFVKLFTYIYNKINFFRYHGKYIQVTRTREQQSLDLHAGVPWENVVLTTFGTDKSLFTNILEEGKM